MSPPVHLHLERISPVDRDEFGLLDRPLRLASDLGESPPFEVGDRPVRDVEVHDDRLGGQVLDESADHFVRDGGSGVPVELGDDVAPRLSLRAEPG